MDTIERRQIAPITGLEDLSAYELECPGIVSLLSRLDETQAAIEYSYLDLSEQSQFFDPGYVKPAEPENPFVDIDGHSTFFGPSTETVLVVDEIVTPELPVVAEERVIPEPETEAPTETESKTLSFYFDVKRSHRKADVPGMDTETSLNISYGLTMGKRLKRAVDIVLAVVALSAAGISAYSTIDGAVRDVDPNNAIDGQTVIGLPPHAWCNLLLHDSVLWDTQGDTWPMYGVPRSEINQVATPQDHCVGTAGTHKGVNRYLHAHHRQVVDKH